MKALIKSMIILAIGGSVAGTALAGPGGTINQGQKNSNYRSSTSLFGGGNR
jgi:hypothetical protein